MKNKEQVAQNENNAVVTDSQHEVGDFPIGKVIHVSTVTHAFRGELEAVTPSHYWLKKGTCVFVHDTGSTTEYANSKKGADEEVISVQVRIPRGAIVWEFLF